MKGPRWARSWGESSGGIRPQRTRQNEESTPEQGLALRAARERGGEGGHNGKACAKGEAPQATTSSWAPRTDKPSQQHRSQHPGSRGHTTHRTPAQTPRRDPPWAVVPGPCHGGVSLRCAHHEGAGFDVTRRLWGGVAGELCLPPWFPYLRRRPRVTFSGEGGAGRNGGGGGRGGGGRKEEGEEGGAKGPEAQTGQQPSRQRGPTLPRLGLSHTSAWRLI